MCYESDGINTFRVKKRTEENSTKEASIQASASLELVDQGVQVIAWKNKIKWHKNVRSNLKLKKRNAHTWWMLTLSQFQLSCLKNLESLESCFGASCKRIYIVYTVRRSTHTWCVSLKSTIFFLFKSSIPAYLQRISPYDSRGKNRMEKKLVHLWITWLVPVATSQANSIYRTFEDAKNDRVLNLLIL